MRLLSLILFILFSFEVFAECKDVNLYEEKSSPLSKIPLYDQDGSGTCYAYTASQLINFYLIKNNKSPGVVIHPAWAASIDSLEKKKSSTYGGFTTSAIESVKKNYYCDYKSVVEGLTSFGKTSNLTEPKVLAFFEKFVSNFLAYKVELPLIKEKPLYMNKMVIDNTRVARRNLFVDSKFEQHNKHVEKARTVFELTKKQMINQCSPSEFDKIEKQILGEFFPAVSKLSFDLILKKCNILKDKKRIPQSMMVSNMDNREVINNQTITSKLQQSLNSGYPSGIHYCSSFINNESKVYTKASASTKSRNLEKDCSAHASIVVASRKNKNSCQFMIKNTWGSYYWASKGSCYCEHKISKKKVQDCNSKTHSLKDYKVLGCWFDSNQLASNIYDVIGVK